MTFLLGWVHNTYMTYLILSTSNEPILGNKYSHKKINIKYIFQNKIILGKFFNKLHFAMNVRFLANSTSDKNNNEIFIPENKMFQYLALIKGTGPCTFTISKKNLFSARSYY